MSSTKQTGKLAVNGGPKAIDGFEGNGRPKIGIAEFMELADTWGFSADRQRRIREALSGVEDEMGNGPFLNRYYNPRPSKVDKFEREAAKLLGAKHVYAVSSGTGALHSAYVAAGVGPGDEVIVPGYTFMATASAVVQAHGIPVFCEIDDSMTIDPADVERKITKRTKAVTPVHMAGMVCNMAAVMRVARKHKLAVIEDCAQAFGASFHGKRVGTIGDLGCYSISSYKPTGGGECGMVVARTAKLLARAQQQAECGGLWRPDRFGPERYPGELFCGGNYRLSELEASVNLVQARRADAQMKRWRRNKRRVVSKLKAYQGIQPRAIHDHDGVIGHSIMFFPPSTADSIKLAQALCAEGVGAGTHAGKRGPDWHVYFDMEPIMGCKSSSPDGCPFTCPHYLEKAPRPTYSPDMCPRTNDLYARGVSVGIDQWWSAGDCAQVARAINKVLGAFCELDPNRESWWA